MIFNHIFVIAQKITAGISQGVFYAIEPENNGGRKSYKPLNAEVSGETQEELYTSFVRFLQTRYHFQLIFVGIKF